MRSGFERTLATQMKLAGVGFKYESIKLPYSLSSNHNYNPDFILDNGIIIEAKGFFRPADVVKMKAVKAQHPHLDIRFVFWDAQKPVCRTKTTHAKWAERHGFPWADREIPKEWLT